VAAPAALVVDDDQDTVDLLEMVLTQAGFSVLTASNGADGVAIAQHQRLALATIDVTMPGMDGIEVTRRIRGFSDAYIVIISSRSQEHDVLAGFDAGADDYVPKPIRPRELQARLRAVARRPLPGMPGGPPPAWSAAPEDSQRSAHLRSDWSEEVGPQVDAAGDRSEPASRGDMQNMGVRFVGSWIDFRGLRINPGRDIVVVDDRYVDVPIEQQRLLEAMLYCGTRILTGRQIALRIRDETEQTATRSASQDERWVAAMMTRLRKQLDDNVPKPRWFEVLPHDRYRLARPL
jgi:two-component system, OmpR family, response regulator